MIDTVAISLATAGLNNARAYAERMELQRQRAWSDYIAARDEAHNAALDVADA